MWWAQWGDKIEALQEIARRGGRVPALEAMPADGDEIGLYLRLYGDVSTDRSVNGFITFQAVAVWCQVYGVPVDDCWQVIRQADARVKEWHSSSSSRSEKQKISKSS